MKYERLTKYNEYSHNAEVYAYSVDKDVYFDGVDIVGNENSSLAQEVIDRLAELEDKIENGTLIELPRIIHPNKAEWYVQYQYPSGVIQYDICFSQAEAEQKLKEEIRNESNI